MINGIEYFKVNGKYTIDGYDLFDTLSELEKDLEWQKLWLAGKAQRTANGWETI